MHSHFLLLLRGLLLCGCLGIAGAAASEEVVWGVSPWPGLVVTSESQPPSGIIKELLGAITARLPEYTHHMRLSNLSRSFEQLSDEGLHCAMPVVRTAERDRVGYYVDLVLVMPNHLVVRKRDRQAIAGDMAEVSLRQLLATPRLRGGLVRDRSYGPQLDPLLNGEYPQLLRIQTSGAGNNLFAMLEHGRIDYIVEYAEIFGAVRSAGGARGLELLPLSEANATARMGAYCSKTAAGARLVRRIDEVARSPEVIALFLSTQRSYLSAATLERYGAMVDDFYLRRDNDLTSLPR